MQVSEIAKKAKEKGLEFIAIVDHSIEHPLGLTEKKAKLRELEIEEAESMYNIKIFSGIECGINSGGEIFLPDYEFDFVIASVHDYVYGKSYYERIFSCLETFEFDVLGHPFSPLFGFNQNIRRMDETLLDMLEEREVAIEINSSHLSPPEEFLELCKDRRLKYSIGSDAHSIVKVGDVKWCFEIAKRYLYSSEPFVP